MADEFFKIPIDSYKTNPTPYPDRHAVIDTVRRKTGAVKISLDDAEMLKENQMMKIQMERENLARFSGLKKEREYYKSYFP